MLTVLYPADYFDETHADGLFESERQIFVSEFGGDAVLFDFDDMKLLTCPQNTDMGAIIYRGWQMPIEKYEVLYSMMEEMGTPLVSPKDYAAMHSADGYFAAVSSLLVPSVNIACEEIFNKNAEATSVIASVFDILGDTVFVKDYVKSVYGKTMMCADDGIEDNLLLLNDIMCSRGDDFAGGFTFKQWHDFDEQVRFFVLGGENVLSVAHDGDWSGCIPRNVPLDLSSPFYTVDMAHSANNGKWYVVECGDGQVSDCGDESSIYQLYTALENNFTQ